MTNTIYRPDPPIETSGSRRVQRTSQVQNDEVHARLFERALVRAEAERRSEARTIDKALDKQHQIARDNEVQSSLRRTETVLSTSLEPDVDVEQLADEQLDDDTSLERDQPNDSTNEMFQNNHTGIDSSQSHTSPSDVGTEPASANSLANQNDLADQINTGVSHLADLPSLYELVDSGGGLSDLKEWSFTFDDDAPVSELTLSREDDGGWRVGVTASAINISNDSGLLDTLQHRLEDVGLAVASVSIAYRDNLT